MADVHFIDTTLRDGQQSLWALNMRTGMMLATLPDLDQAGFEAIEFFLPSVQIKKMVQHLGEDPFEWLRRGTEHPLRTPLRMHGGMRGGMSKIPSSVTRRMAEMVASRGIHVTRTSDPWNDFAEVAEEIEELRNIGLESVLNLIYSESPKHTDEYFVERAKQAAAVRPYRICFKDVGGLLTPDRTRRLVRLIRQAVGDVPLEFHAHCNNSLGPINVLEAVREGIEYIHTAVPPLANGSSQPSIFNVARNLRAMGHRPLVDEAPLRTASKRLTEIATRHGLPIGRPLEFDCTQYLHQVPGGMISNLRHQLEIIGREDLLQQVLEEATRVRADFGYPIMVTPLSQFVGTQAAFNVIVGERYREVPDEVIQLALGLWGKEGGTGMDQQVRAKILDRPRSREWERWEPPQLSLEDIRRKLGGGVTDEEIIVRVFAGDEAVAVLGKTSSPEPYLSARHPLVTLVDELTSKRGLSYVAVQKGDLAVTLGSRAVRGTAQ